MWNIEIRFQISHHRRGKVTYVLKNKFISMGDLRLSRFYPDLDFVIFLCVYIYGGEGKHSPYLRLTPQLATTSP